jgi:hypothetical protein
MTEDEIIENEKKQEEYGKKTDEEIVSSDNITTIDDILEYSDNYVIVKLKRLKDFGITNEQIKSLYLDKSGGLENEQAALETLNVVFNILAKDLSDTPNGIVIDLSSGKRNEAESIKQEYEIMYTVSENLDENSIQIIPKEKEHSDVDKLNENFRELEYYNSFSEGFDINQMEKNIKKMEESTNISKEISNEYRETVERLSRFDTKEMEFTNLEIKMLKTKKDSPEREALF